MNAALCTNVHSGQTETISSDTDNGSLGGHKVKNNNVTLIYINSANMLVPGCKTMGHAENGVQ